MKRLLAITAVAVVLLVGAGCKSKSKDVFPMTVGSTWAYEGYVSAESTLAAADTVATTTLNIKVERETSLESGETVVEISRVTSLHILASGSTLTDTAMEYCRDVGDVILSYSSLSDSTADTVMMNDLSVGKTWVMGAGTAEVTAQEAVTVPAGSYSDAWKVKVTYTGNEWTNWVAPGVGLVKTANTYQESGTTYVAHSELTEVTIK